MTARAGFSMGAPSPMQVRADDDASLTFGERVLVEARRTRIRFGPQDSLTLIAAAAEELGELAQAVLERQGEDRIMAKAVQLAAMAQRLVKG